MGSPPPDLLARALRRRRAGALVGSIALPALLVFGLGHRGNHAARNLLVPGAGLFGEAMWVGVGFVVLAVVATVCWVKWGADWTVVAVVGVSMLCSALVTPATHELAMAPVHVFKESHEFPLVMLVIAAWQWMRRLPVLNRLHGRRPPERDGLASLGALPPVDRCRAVSILALAGEVPADAAATAYAPDVVRRACRVGRFARGRSPRAALRRDNAALRTALSLTGSSPSMHDDAARQLVGVPASEPGWIRLLDGVLAAVVLDRRGDAELVARWRRALDRQFPLRRGRRAADYWTPLGVSIGAATPWEHATATALARSRGWLEGDADWVALRPAALGAAARGAQRPDDERFIAAARLWLTMVDDPEASRVLARPTVRRDPLAVAIDRVAANAASRQLTGGSS